MEAEAVEEEGNERAERRTEARAYKGSVSGQTGRNEAARVLFVRLSTPFLPPVHPRGLEPSLYEPRGPLQPLLLHLELHPPAPLRSPFAPPLSIQGPPSSFLHPVTPFLHPQPLLPPLPCYTMHVCTPFAHILSHRISSRAIILITSNFEFHLGASIRYSTCSVSRYVSSTFPTISSIRYISLPSFVQHPSSSSSSSSRDSFRKPTSYSDLNPIYLYSTF